ncbi:NYN domain-containing protein [Bacillus sp. WP8]|uniref:NYN domain-containing protein n=1 Tax=Bacillus sp. WP8 TaxID=756828 RepID=UPI0021B20BDD|nr:NYN domain-containing protein [Bacillus sp. WP8]
MIVVLDADMVKGIEKKGRNEGVEVMFRRENERGDEGIEKVGEDLNNIGREIDVGR